MNAFLFLFGVSPDSLQIVSNTPPNSQKKIVENLTKQMTLGIQKSIARVKELEAALAREQRLRIAAEARAEAEAEEEQDGGIVVDGWGEPGVGIDDDSG